MRLRRRLGSIATSGTALPRSDPTACTIAWSASSGSWADRLTAIVTELGFETLLVGAPADDPVGFIRRLGEEIAPVVARARASDAG